MTSFDEAVALKPAGELRWRAEIPSDWGQGRTTFGGLVASLATRAAAEVAGPDRPLRTIDVAFVAALPPGPVDVAAEVLGEGRAVTQLTATISRDGVPGGRAHLVCGAPRATTIAVHAPGTEHDGRTDPETEGLAAPYVEGVMPAFTQHLDMRWVSTALPYGGAGPEGAHIRGWCRHRTPASGLEAVVALLDAWPPTVLTMANGPAPGSTVRWSAHFLRQVPAGAERDWFWYEADTVHAADGYATTRAELYLAGELVVWSEQLVVVYDRPGGS